MFAFQWGVSVVNEEDCRMAYLLSQLTQNQQGDTEVSSFLNSQLEVGVAVMWLVVHSGPETVPSVTAG